MIATITVKVADLEPVASALNAMTSYLECVDQNGELMCQSELDRVRESVANLDPVDGQG